ncbi:MAG: amino acid ABC transporter permease [Thermoplasmata archaeon]|nr:amino acid ABC transporter permease [Thermoplasmata archaeon]
MWILLGVAVSAGIFLLLGELGYYSLPFIFATLPSGVGPAIGSLELTTDSFLIGFVIALPLGILRAFPPRAPVRRPGAPREPSRSRIVRGLTWPLYAAASAYVAVIRGTPFLVQVLLVYYAVIFAYPRFVFLGQGVSFWAGLLALTINTAGYQAEALRGGFQSVDVSQIEAGRAIGMRSTQIFWRITFPQAIRLVTLPLTNEWISNFKTSAIVSYIAYAELFSWGRTYVAYQLARPVEAFVMIAIFYLVINVTLSRVVSAIESERRIPGLGTPVRDVGRRGTSA